MPYAAAAKLVTANGASGLFILPGVIAGTVVTLPLLVALLGWQRHLGGNIAPRMIASGIATAAIIATTTIAYSFRGISIVLALLFMRGGVVMIAPIVDAIGRRRIRWFSGAAMVLSIIAIAVVLHDVESYDLTIAAILNLAMYLAGYCVRLSMMTRIAKVEDVSVTRHYLLNEMMVALITLVVAPPLIALIRPDSDLARGMAGIWTSELLVPSLTIGVLYAVLFIAGTLVYLDRRENTFCVVLNRGASLLSGVTATYLLAAFARGTPSGPPELMAVALIMVALTLLSPMHHAVEVLHEAWRVSRTTTARRLPLE